MSSTPDDTSPLTDPLAPLDAFDRRLLANTRPPSWINPKPAARYNLVVIGGGTAGLVTAAGAAALGAKVALVERSRLGGDCLNVGCVPSKALLRSARAAADVRDAGRFGVRVPKEVSVDFPAVMERMRRIRAEISPHDSVSRFTAIGVDVFLGEARFTASDRVEVGGVELRFARACIATGSRPAELTLPGLDRGDYLTNESLFELRELPRRLAVFGGGPIGSEMAQAFARFGSHVTLLTSDSGLLPKDDPEAAAAVRQALEADGVRVNHFGRVASVVTIGDSKRLSFPPKSNEPDVEVDAILVAVGRSANIEHLGFAAAGVEADERGVAVNDFLQTSNPNIYAAGDVCSKYKFTHAADAMARIVVQNSLAFGRKRFSDLIVPWCTYTDPELAHVGLDPREADEHADPIDTFRIDLTSLDRGMTEGDEGGFLKIRVRRGSDKILGATIVAPSAGDLISQITLAMQTGVGLKTLAGVIHPYPTRSELIRKAADAYNRTRLTPRLRRLSAMIMRWRR